MELIKKSVVLILLLTAAGCTTMGPPYTPPPAAPSGQSLVYLMRSSVGYGNFWETIFSINDVQVVSLYDKGYSWVHLKPGKYKFSGGNSLNPDYLKFNMPIAPGQTYYVEYGQSYAGYNQYRNYIRALKPAIGENKIKDYSYAPADTSQLK